MIRYIKVFIWINLSLAVLLPFAGPVWAQDSPVKITLMSSQEVYDQGYPIQLQIKVFNNNLNPETGLKDPVIARQGFFSQDFSARA